MIEKMSLERFQQIKDQLSKVYEEFSEKFATLVKNNQESEASALLPEFYEKYLSVEKELLDFDLSDIPFEAWQGMIIASNNDVVDFSKTKANIDFNLVDCEGNINFSGCNVRNVGSLGRNLASVTFDANTINENQDVFLPNIFDDAFRTKFYNNELTFDDIANLSNEQLEEIKKKDIKKHIHYSERNDLLIQILGLDKIIDFYKYSKQDYEVVNSIIRNYSYVVDRNELEELTKAFKDVAVADLKKACFDYQRKRMIEKDNVSFNQEVYPKEFVEANKDLFLVDVNIPEEVKQRFFYKELTTEDLIDYYQELKGIPVDFFMKSGSISGYFLSNYGRGKLQELIEKYPDVFRHIADKKEYQLFTSHLRGGKTAEIAFRNAVKRYVLFHDDTKHYFVESGKLINEPEWLATMHFKYIGGIYTLEDLLQCDDSTFVINQNQENLLSTLGIENIKKLEQQIGFFSHQRDFDVHDLPYLNALSYFLNNSNQSFDFAEGSLDYPEFLDEFAKCLDAMRANNIFTDYGDYDWIRGEFRDSHPEIFIDLNAPMELRDAFYFNRITPEFLYEHKEYIPYLVDKNMINTIRADMRLVLSGVVDDKGRMLPNYSNFLSEYVTRYGNEKLLQLVAKYGKVLSSISLTSLHNEIDSEEEIEKALRKSIYRKVIEHKDVNSYVDYEYLSGVSEMTKEYPDIFVNFDSLESIPEEERAKLTEAFYHKKLVFDDIKKYPELITILKDKCLEYAFGNCRELMVSVPGVPHKIDKTVLIKTLGNERFLQICAKYGRYMDSAIITKVMSMIGENQTNIDGLLEELPKRIEAEITRKCQDGTFAYTYEDAPMFLRQNNPELFLDKDAPDNLKTFFYNYAYNYPMSFTVLAKNKDWLPYLNGKALATSLLRRNYVRNDLIKFFQLFGEEKAIRLGISRAETVEEMLQSHNVELMKSWYDKTGGKFIPDFVVMQNFSLEDADKFLASGSNWSTLMRIQSFARTQEARDAMLKLAYSFGAFDQDQRGFKKLQDLLTSLPRKIDADKEYIIDRINHVINIYSQRGAFYHNKAIIDINGIRRIEAPNMTPEEKEAAYNKMIEYAKNNRFEDLIDTDTLVNFLETLKKEKVDVDFAKPIFSQLYKKNEDGTYTLTINSQSYPKSSQIVRDILGKFSELPILTPNKAHQLFGGFELKYNPDFREFLLANIETIMKNPEYGRLVASVQRQFSEIKAINSNRVLTWELAVSYVQTNKFTSINVGNERVAEISAIAGYSQSDFNTLQQIYNYGKQRTFSSIPRIQESAE